MPTISTAEIQALLDAGRVVEAGALLTMHGGKLEPEEWQALESQRQRLWSRATTLIAEGESLEQIGKNAEAQQCYRQVAAFAADFPGINERCSRVGEALTLANAVRLRSKRIRAQPERTNPTSPTGKTRNVPVLLIAGIVLLGFGAGIWWSHGPPGKRQELEPTEPAAGVTVQSAAIPPASPASQSTAQENQKQAEPGQPAKDPAPVVAAHPRTDTPPRPAVPFSAPQPPAPKSSEQSPAAAVLPSPAQDQAQPREKTYTVQPGDSLSKIAQRLFCDEDLWQQIHARNRDQVKNPNRLAPGVQIRLTGIKSRCRQPR